MMGDRAPGSNKRTPKVSQLAGREAEGVSVYFDDGTVVGQLESSCNLRLAAFKASRLSQTATVVLSAAAARSNSSHSSLGQRNWCCGILPVAGLPRGRFSTLDVFIPTFYGLTENIQY